jgi:predicted MFS family arabinose efflux permease
MFPKKLATPRHNPKLSRFGRSLMTTNTRNHPGETQWTPARERLLLLTLAAIQFTTVLDFVIIMPLGPQYKEVFHITNSQFAMIVGAYGISAGLTGLAAGFFLDRFDRKTALLWLYFGFALGTLFCAMSRTYELLVAARFFAGIFGGVVGAVILAIVGDVIPMERRGSAMGMVMSSFSVASIVGVPAGILIAHQYSWHVPFYAIAGISAVILPIALSITPPLREHMRHADKEHPVLRTWKVMTHPDHVMAFILMAGITSAGFFIFPYIPVYMVSNVGLRDDQLAWLYFAGGICTVFSMNWVGQWSDRSGKLRVFALTSLSTALPIALVTNLPHVPLMAAIGAMTLLMICMSSRMVPAMAMMTGVVEARYRGGFMSINSAVQQLSMGLSAWLSGFIVGTAADGKLTNFYIAGMISIVCAYTCIYLARFLKPAPENREPINEPIFVEHG